MDPAELGHRIVAVLEKDALVELLRSGQADGGVDAVVPAHVQVADELVEEQPPQALGRAGVTGEQRPFTTSGRLTSANTGPSRFVK